MRESWLFRLCGGLPRDVAVLGDLRPVLSCIAHLCRKDPRRPSNRTFVAVPHSKINTSRRPPSALIVLVAIASAVRTDSGTALLRIII